MTPAGDRHAEDSGADADFVDALRHRLPLTPVPHLGGIGIHRAAPSSGLASFARFGAGRAPYWAFPWPGGVALARHVLDVPACVADRRVLDLGCGCGIVAIAAAMAGATRVIAADVDPLAMRAAQVNAAANGVSSATIKLDLGTDPCPDVDIVLAGDLFYDRRLARRSLAFLQAAAACGIDVLVGDPGRPHLPLDRLQRVAGYRVAEVGATTGAGDLAAGVFRFLA